MKYVVLRYRKDGNLFPIMFPDVLAHKDAVSFALNETEFLIVSAGMFGWLESGKVRASGCSASLQAVLKRPVVCLEADSALLERFLTGGEHDLDTDLRFTDMSLLGQLFGAEDE